MSPKRWRVIVTILALAAMLFVSLIAWLIGTPQGAGWLLMAVSDLSSLEISSTGIKGRLWDDLRLRGLKITWKEGYLTADEFNLRWQPAYLLTGSVAASEISLENLFIQDNSVEKETDLKWPEIAGILSRLDGWIDSLKIDNFSVRIRDQGPVAFRKISSMVIWHDRRLTLKDFAVISAKANATGTIYTSFERPFLHADIKVCSSTPIYGMTFFLIKMNLSAAAKPLQMKGPFSIAGSDSLKVKINLKGEIELERYAVLIENFFLSESTRRGLLTGQVKIDFKSAEPTFRGSVRLNDLDLSPELKPVTHLQGQVSIQGNIWNYAGTLKLSNSGEKWRAAELSGSFRGDEKGFRFLLCEGSWLRGSLQGEIKGSWENGISMFGNLSARNIDPASIASGWSGRINFDISGKMYFPKKGQTSGELSGKILNSMLQGRALNGEVKMNLDEKNLIIKRLFLHGKGFYISAKGEFRKRLTFFANVTELSGLVPETKGSLRAEGWIILQKHLKAAGTIISRNLTAGNLTVEAMNLDARVYTSEKLPIRLAGNLKGIRYGEMTINSAQAEISGSEERHSLRLSLHANQWSLNILISGAYIEKVWSGKIIELYGRDAVGTFKADKLAGILVSAERISLTDISLKGNGQEHIKMRLQVNLNSSAGSFHLDWAELNLARGNQWIKRITLKGKTSGEVNTAWRGVNLSTLTGRVEASGLLGFDDQLIEVEKTSLNIDWNTRSLGVVLDMQMKKYGTVTGKIIMSQPVCLGLPDRADIDVRISGLDAILLRSLLPEKTDLKGNLSAQIKGKLLPGKRKEISGRVNISNGKLHLGQKGELNAELRSAQISFLWREDKLSGDLELSLADYGNLTGNFLLPIPARLPISLEKDKPLRVSIKGTAHEKGILTFLFPGLVQESHGNLNLDLVISGSWTEPNCSGNLQLADAGAFLPSAGITLKSVTSSARFEQNRIVVKTFSAKSGNGEIRGNAEIKIKRLSITEYKGRIEGENFQAVYLPHLQASINPGLTFEGRKNNASLSGEIKVTELFIYGNETHVIKPSRDVIIVDAPKKKERKIPLNLDINVRVIMGEKVFVKMEGIDAKLKGRVDLKASSLEDIRGSGIVEVVKGKYRKYGIDLDIKRGKAVFAGGPANNPSLDVLALREIEDIKAGVLATGTLQLPRISLYSEPQMPDTDILSYIVLGHLPSADREQIALLSHAAGLLLSGGESVTLQAKLQQRLGIDVLDIESGSGEIARSVLTVGKYLSPRLYVGYGVSLFTGQNIFSLKYKLSKRFELQTESGGETGMDLYYKIEFK